MELWLLGLAMSSRSVIWWLAEVPWVMGGELIWVSGWPWAAGERGELWCWPTDSALAASRVPYSGRRRHTQYSCVHYSLTTLEWKNGQQEIVAAGWAVEGDGKLVWAPEGDEKEVIDWTEIISINVRKKKNIVCNWVLFLTAFDLLVAGGTHKGTGSSFQRDQSSLDCCAWGTSPLFQALLPCQTLRLALGGGGGIDHIQIYSSLSKRKSLSLHLLLVRPFLGII